MKREDIIKENFVYVTCNYDGKFLVRIYKPYTMGDLPVDLIIMDAASKKLNAGLPSKGNWSYIDTDTYGPWAAHYVLHRHGRICDLYVCALLIRPYSKEALEEYEKGTKLEETERLQLMWDSRAFDKENRYKPLYTIMRNQSISLWHMDAERLSWIEDRLNQEQIMERAKTLRPIGEPKGCGGMRFWIKADHIHSESYTWNLEKLQATGHLEELGTILTYHQSSPFFAKPSVDECVYQCPFNDATAFMITRIGSYNGELGRLECETTYFKGKIPQEVLEREILW